MASISMATTVTSPIVVSPVSIRSLVLSTVDSATLDALRQRARQVPDPSRRGAPRTQQPHRLLSPPGPMLCEEGGVGDDDPMHQERRGGCRMAKSL